MKCSRKPIHETTRVFSVDSSTLLLSAAPDKSDDEGFNRV
jgi:hypothetical protein